jgi:ParB-like chromosome segregation protein Spo0J
MKILNSATETVEAARLTPHPRNVNRGDTGAIRESMKANGWFGRLIVQRSTGHILAGNHRFAVGRDLGMEEFPVEWVDVNDADALRILLVDNRTARLGGDDNAALAALLQEILTEAETLAGTGYGNDFLADLLAELAGEGGDGSGDALAENYSRKIEAPIYTPKGDKPAEAELFDRARTDALRAEIEAADLPAEVADFLRNAAERHTVFRFDRIAEYYAHAPKETQELMERSALVIIDFNQAVELGYVRLTEKMLEQAGYSKANNYDA